MKHPFMLELEKAAKEQKLEGKAKEKFFDDMFALGVKYGFLEVIEKK